MGQSSALAFDRDMQRLIVFPPSRCKISIRKAQTIINCCDTVGELTLVLRLYSHLFGLARVATDFLFYPKGKVKKHGKNLLRCFVGSGGRL